MNQPNPIGQLYDRLLGAETSKVADNDLTIHKRLRFPAADRAQGIADSNDWLRANLPLTPTTHILDAGCGVGGTLFALLDEQRTGLGITLSERQVAVAQQEAARRGLNGRCHFQQQSYDDPLPGTFDLIIAIEALSHSLDLAQSLQNLSRALKPGGHFVILEDMATTTVTVEPAVETAAHGSRSRPSPTKLRRTESAKADFVDVAATLVTGAEHDKTALHAIWQQSWCLHTVYTEVAYRAGLAAAGLDVVKTADFTLYVQTHPWPTWFIQLAWHSSQKLPRRWRGAKDIFIGGWALEALYRQGRLSYQLLIAQKRP